MPKVKASAVSFDTGGESFPFYAATSTAAVTLPFALVADSASNLSDRLNTSCYPSSSRVTGWRPGRSEMANYRSQQGLSAVMARTADFIYDEFSDGVKTPWAIHDFLRHAAENWV